MSSFKRKSGGRMIEFIQIAPGICCVTALAARNASAGKGRRHSIGKLTVMRILVAHRASTVFKTEFYRF